MDLMKVQKKNDLYQTLTFDQLCDHYGLLDSHLLPLLEVDRRTLKNWRTKDNAPMMARKLVAMESRGMLSVDWEGFYIKGDTLHTPMRQAFTTGEILGFHYKFQMIHTLRLDNLKLKAANDKLKSRINAANGIFREDGTLKQLKLL